MRKFYGWSLLSAALVCAGMSVNGMAQERETREVRPATTNKDNANQAHRTADQQFAACIYNANRNEVEISKFAQQRLQGEAAKEFAAKMIKEHQQGMDKFGKLAGNLTSDTGRDVNRSDADRTDATRRADDAVRGGEATKSNTGVLNPNPAVVGNNPNAAAQHQVNWTAIHREMADQCLASGKAELETKKGADVDKCYIGMQVAGHMHMVDSLKVLERHASAELKTEIASAREMAEHHLKEAKKIMSEIKDEPSSGSSKASSDK